MKKLILLVISFLIFCLATTVYALPINVALTGTATQSSLYSGGIAGTPDLAIDGDTNGA